MATPVLLFSRKQGALLPEVELTLTPVGFTYDLATATGVEFRYRKKGEVTVETIACTITDAPNKKVKMTPTSAVVDVVGTHQAHVKVTFPGPKEMYFPETGFDEFKITENF